MNSSAYSPGGLPLNSKEFLGTESSTPHTPQTLEASLFDVGIFRDTLLPSSALHSSLALAAYAAGRATNRVEAKDWLWPAAPVLNAWWTAVGRRVYNGLPLSRALISLSRPERLLLTGITLWGSRLLYRVSRRSIKRGKDDPRYEATKKQENFWNKALFTVFLPEALIQTLISLPLTAPFRHQGAVLTGYHPHLQGLAVGLFSAGFALETLADWQLEKHQAEGNAETSVLKEGVWSIVRHPNYLGDVLIHLSFPLLLYSSDMLAPIELLGPLANYLFLRHLGGDKETEAHQEAQYAATKKAEFDSYRQSNNSIWPDWQQVKNQWAWIVVGAGAVGVAVEQVVDTFL